MLAVRILGDEKEAEEIKDVREVRESEIDGAEIFGIAREIFVTKAGISGLCEFPTT